MQDLFCVIQVGVHRRTTLNSINKYISANALFEVLYSHHTANVILSDEMNPMSLHVPQPKTDAYLLSAVFYFSPVFHLWVLHANFFCKESKPFCLEPLVNTTSLYSTV